MIYPDRGSIPAELRSAAEESNCVGHPSCIFPLADPARVPVLDYSAAGVDASLKGSLGRLGLGGVPCCRASVRGLRLHDCETPERVAAAVAPGMKCNSFLDFKKIILKPV